MAAGRIEILDAVNTALSAISTGGGYYFTVGTVEKLLRDWNDGSTFPRPWVGFRPTIETYEYQPARLIRCTMGLQIVGHLSVTAGAVTDYEPIEKLGDDLIKALRQGVLRAGCAESITLQQTETTTGDPSAVESASLSMLFNITYYRTEPTS